MPFEIVEIAPVDIRQVFPKEDKDFTPWLAQNLARIASLTGLEDLELVQEEHPIGDYSCDIVARHSGGIAIIENQFGKSDHNHFGKLMVYASGVKANYIVFIAEQIREEHAAAINYWNSLLGEKCAIFGIEVGLITLGDNKVAVNLDVVERPNHWQQSREIKAGIYPERVVNFAAFMNEKHSFKFKVGGSSASHRFATHSYLLFVINKSTTRLEVGIWKPQIPDNDEYFAKHQKLVEDFANELGLPTSLSLSGRRRIFRIEGEADTDWLENACVKLLAILTKPN